MQTAVFEALGDPIRSRIVEILAARELEAGAIASRFDISRPAISRHLRVLRESGVVVAREEGAKRIYSLRPQTVTELIRWTERLRKRMETQLDVLGEHLDHMKGQEDEHDAAPGDV